MSGFGKQKWAFAAAGAYACVMLFFLVRPSVTPVGQPPGGNGGAANPVGAKGKPVEESPAYDPRVNRARPLPTKIPEVIVF